MATCFKLLTRLLDGRLLADRGIKFEISDAARDWLGRDGYDSVNGAPLMKRAV